MKPGCCPENLGAEKGSTIHRIAMLASVHSFHKRTKHLACIRPVACPGNTQIKEGSVPKELPAWERDR